MITLLFDQLVKLQLMKIDELQS